METLKYLKRGIMVDILSGNFIVVFQVKNWKILKNTGSLVG